MTTPIWEIEDRKPTSEELADFWRKGRIKNARNEIRLIDEGIKRLEERRGKWHKFVEILESERGELVCNAMELIEDLGGKPLP